MKGGGDDWRTVGEEESELTVAPVEGALASLLGADRRRELVRRREVEEVATAAQPASGDSGRQGSRTNGGRFGALGCRLSSTNGNSRRGKKMSPPEDESRSVLCASPFCRILYKKNYVSNRLF